MTEPRYFVRPAKPDDLDALVAFNQAMARETEGLALDERILRAGVAALLGDPLRGRWFVIESGGELAAALTITTEWSDWRNGWFWWIQSVYVRPDHRRQGLYRMLHEHVQQLAEADPGVCGLRLYVERENTSAQQTYRAMGMHETHYRMYEQPTRK